MNKEVNEIIQKYKNGEKTLEETNASLKEIGAEFFLDPDAKIIEECNKAHAALNIAKINGYAMLDTGTGSMDKVLVVNGKLAESIGNMKGLVIIDDHTFVVRDGVTLEEK